VFPSCISENLSCKGSLGEFCPFSSVGNEIIERLSSVVVFHGERSFFHLFETKSESAILKTWGDELMCHVDSCRSSSAVVVYVVDWDTRHANFVNSFVSAAWIAIDVSNWSGLYLIVWNSRIPESSIDSLLCHDMIIWILWFARLDKFSHAYSNNEHSVFGFRSLSRSYSTHWATACAWTTWSISTHRTGCAIESTTSHRASTSLCCVSRAAHFLLLE